MTREGRNAGNFNYGATGTALVLGRDKLAAGAHGYSLWTNLTLEGEMSVINNGVSFTEIGCYE